MNRDTAVYCTCTFLLGLVIGSFLIGPHIGARQPEVATAANMPAAAATQSDPMPAVMQQLTALKEQIARDPKNADALAQLGNMYMDAAKFPEAIQYFERALAVREDPTLRIDLGISYKQSGEPDKALAAFRRAAEEAPGQWQPLYNEAIVLGEMRRFDEAKAIAANLKKMRPDDPEVRRLVDSLAQAR